MKSIWMYIYLIVAKRSKVHGTVSGGRPRENYIVWKSVYTANVIR